MVLSGREVEGYQAKLNQPSVVTTERGRARSERLTSRLKRRLAYERTNASWPTVMKHFCRIRAPDDGQGSDGMWSSSGPSSLGVLALRVFKRDLDNPR